MKALVHYVIVLVSICGVSAGLLATIYEVTKEPIAASRRQQTLDAIQTVLPPFERVIDAADVRDALGSAGAALPEMYPAFAGDDFLGAAIKVTDPGGYGGDVTFMVGVTPDGRIHAIRVLSHKETPGLGTKLADEPFAGQFRGLEVPDQGLSVRRDGGTIDAITGATISSRTATNAATEAARIFRENSSRLRGLGSDDGKEGGPLG
jgi:Na+-translocating ferredoxin:NAD+ oxidoreductase subunit G